MRCRTWEHTCIIAPKIKQGSVEIKRGTLSANSIPFDFENDYVKTKWLHDKASALILIE